MGLAGSSSWRTRTALLVVLLVTELVGATEHFSEELVLRPLWDGSVLAQFTFTTHLNHSDRSSLGFKSGSDSLVSSAAYDLFPKPVSQIVSKHSLVELHVSLTRGRWLYDRWGEPLEATPTGAEVVAWQHVSPYSQTVKANSNSSDTELEDGEWSRLSHSLAGLLCASLNTMATASTTLAISPFDRSPLARLLDSTPWRKGRSSDGRAVAQARNHFGREAKEVHLTRRSMRYAVLPQEAICTENLTPWLKLLPCGDKEGLGLLLHSRQRVFSARFQSLKLHVINHALRAQIEAHTLKQGLEHPLSAVELRQTFALVLDPSPGSSSLADRKSFKLSQLFKEPSAGETRTQHSKKKGKPEPSEAASERHLLLNSCTVSSSSKVVLELDERLAQSVPSKIDTDADKSDVLEGFLPDGARKVFTMKPRPQIKSTTSTGRVRLDVSEILINAPENGSDITFWWRDGAKELPLKPSLPVSIQRSLGGKGGPEGSLFIEIHRTPGSDLSTSLGLCVFQLFPWFIQIYMHTFHLTSLGDDQFEQQDYAVNYEPADGRTTSTELEVCFRMKPYAVSTHMSIEFEKKFLNVFDFPADANRGFDLPAALLAPLYDSWEVIREGSPPSSSYLASPLYSQTAVIRMPMPDFSMPYNVVALTCTVLSLFVASTLGSLLYRFDKSEDHRPLLTRVVDFLRTMIVKVKSKTLRKDH